MDRKIIIARRPLDIIEYCAKNKIPPSKRIGVTTNYHGAWYKLYGITTNPENVIWLNGWEQGTHAEEVKETIMLCTIKKERTR